MYELPDEGDEMATESIEPAQEEHTCGAAGDGEGGHAQAQANAHAGLFGAAAANAANVVASQGGGHQHTFMPMVESQGGCGPDYCTPAEGGGGVGCGGTQEPFTQTQGEDKENYCTQEGAGIVARSPGSLPPVGKVVKRRRPNMWAGGFGPSQSSQGYGGSQFNGSVASGAWDSCTEISTQETDRRMEAPSGGLFGTQGEATSGPTAAGGSQPFAIAAPRVGLSRARRPNPIKAALASPGVARNPFLDDEGAAGSGRTLPRLKVLPSRYRSDFREERELGKGAYSKVFACRRRLDGCMYAVKVSRQPLHNDGDRRHAVGEVQALAAVGPHPNLVQYFGAFEEGGHLYIQLELCGGGALDAARERGERLPERALMAMVAHIGGALAHMHAKGVAHMDIKPDNVYCTADPVDAGAPGGGAFKLGDLGSACHLDGKQGFKEGDCRYMPAEILNDDFRALGKADVWSLGAAVYELARPPPRGERCAPPLPREGPSFAAIRAGKLTLLPGVSSSFQALLRRMMERDASKRPSAAEAATAAQRMLDASS